MNAVSEVLTAPGAPRAIRVTTECRDGGGERGTGAWTPPVPSAAMGCPCQAAAGPSKEINTYKQSFHFFQTKFFLPHIAKNLQKTVKSDQ